MDLNTTRPDHPVAALRYFGLVLGLGWLIAPAVAQAQLFGPLSEEGEVAVGRTAAANIEKGLELLSDDPVTSYISDLGQVQPKKLGTTLSRWPNALVVRTRSAWRTVRGHSTTGRWIVEVLHSDDRVVAREVTLGEI